MTKVTQQAIAEAYQILDVAIDSVTDKDRGFQLLNALMGTMTCQGHPELFLENEGTDDEYAFLEWE